MRQQNPPSTFIEKAEALEKYLRPTPLGCLYGVIFVLYAAAMALVFAGLVLGSALDPTHLTITIAVIIGCLPAVSALVAYLRRPNDPLSYYITGLANAWRCPLEAPADQCTFKTGFRGGAEDLLVKLAFHYPTKQQVPEIKERLYTYVRAALTSEFSMKLALPSYLDIERALDPSLEMLAAEYKIPVLYPEILDVRIIRDVYRGVELAPSWREVDSAADEYQATGTAG
jgi:hypothetical protein